LLRGETNSFGWLFTNTKINIFIYIIMDKG
jgi:hypothetical protein